jgi:hypothetical protein
MNRTHEAERWHGMRECPVKQQAACYVGKNTLFGIAA